MFKNSVLKSLTYERIEVANWIRIFGKEFPDPLGTSNRLSRFCNPKYNSSVLYVARSLQTAFVETMVRDKHDGLTLMTIPERILSKKRIAEVSSTVPLRVVNLTGTNMISQGLPSDMVGSADQTIGQDFAASMYNLKPEIDGILYPSRLVHDEVCLAVYDRAIYKLNVNLG